jgi:hypothetical protein
MIKPPAHRAIALANYFHFALHHLPLRRTGEMGQGSTPGMGKK